MFSQNWLCPLHLYGVIRVHGPDARAFLHGQLTQNIETLGTGESRLAAWCSAQGRVLALFRVFAHDDAVYLRLPRALLPVTLQRLRMFVLRSQVTLEDASDTWARFGVCGITPAAGEDIVMLPITGTRIEVHGPTRSVEGLRTELAEKHDAHGDDVWTLHEILAGLPEIHPATRETFVPQMLNLEQLGAIDFRKGCYPGQEIVARAQYRGQVKRRMIEASIDSEPPLPGAGISGVGDTTGTVVHAARDPNGGSRLLAVLPLDALSSTHWTLAESGNPLRILQTSPETPGAGR